MLPSLLSNLLLEFRFYTMSRQRAHFLSSISVIFFHFSEDFSTNLLPDSLLPTAGDGPALPYAAKC